MTAPWLEMNETREVPAAPPPRPPKKGNWYLLTGLVIGFILGLVYAWLLNPVVYEHTAPANLREADKDTYRSLIAQVYASTGDLKRAASRLALLEDAEPVFTLGAQAQRLMAEGRVEEARALALLAAAVQTGMAWPTASPSPVPTQTLPMPSPTP